MKTIYIFRSQLFNKYSNLLHIAAKKQRDAAEQIPPCWFFICWHLPYIFIRPSIEYNGFFFHFHCVSNCFANVSWRVVFVFCIYSFDVSERVCYVQCMNACVRVCLCAICVFQNFRMQYFHSVLLGIIKSISIELVLI